MKNLALLALIVATGCASHQYPVRLESEPPGARVYFSAGAFKKTSPNRSYLGQTPCTAMIEGHKGYFKLPSVAYASDYVAGIAVISADPPTGVTNSSPKSYTFKGSTDWADGDKIPKALFFDFTK